MLSHGNENCHSARAGLLASSRAFMLAIHLNGEPCPSRFVLPVPACRTPAEDEFNRGVDAKSVALSDRWEMLDAAGWENAKKFDLDKRNVPRSQGNRTQVNTRRAELTREFLRSTDLCHVFPSVVVWRLLVLCACSFLCARKKPALAFRLLPPSSVPPSQRDVTLHTLNYLTRRLQRTSISAVYWLRTLADLLQTTSADHPLYLFAQQHTPPEMGWFLQMHDGSMWFKGHAPNGGLTRHQVRLCGAADLATVQADILRKAEGYEPPYWAV